MNPPEPFLPAWVAWVEELGGGGAGSLGDPGATLAAIAGIEEIVASVGVMIGAEFRALHPDFVGLVGDAQRLADEAAVLSWEAQCARVRLRLAAEPVDRALRTCGLEMRRRRLGQVVETLERLGAMRDLVESVRAHVVSMCYLDALCLVDQTRAACTDLGALVGAQILLKELDALDGEAQVGAARDLVDALVDGDDETVEFYRLHVSRARPSMLRIASAEYAARAPARVAATRCAQTALQRIVAARRILQATAVAHAVEALDEAVARSIGADADADADARFVDTHAAVSPIIAAAAAVGVNLDRAVKALGALGARHVEALATAEPSPASVGTLRDRVDECTAATRAYCMQDGEAVAGACRAIAGVYAGFCEATRAALFEARGAKPGGEAPRPITVRQLCVAWHTLDAVLTDIDSAAASIDGAARHFSPASDQYRLVCTELRRTIIATGIAGIAGEPAPRRAAQTNIFEHSVRRHAPSGQCAAIVAMVAAGVAATPAARGLGSLGAEQW